MPPRFNLGTIFSMYAYPHQFKINIGHVLAIKTSHQTLLELPHNNEMNNCTEQKQNSNSGFTTSNYSIIEKRLCSSVCNYSRTKNYCSYEPSVYQDLKPRLTDNMLLKEPANAIQSFGYFKKSRTNEGKESTTLLSVHYLQGKEHS